MKQIESFIRHWPLALFLMLLFGGFAWFIWRPGSYRAFTRLSVGIDYNRTGKLDDLEEDRLLGITEDIIHSDAVMQKVFLQQSSESDYVAFFHRTALTRTNQTWSLMISGEDPEEIGRAAVFWLNTAYEALRSALDHAVRAEALQNELEGLTRCIQDSDLAVMTAACPDDPEEIHRRIEELGGQISEELLLSGGISPSIRLGPKNSGELNMQLANRSAAAYTLIGALIGLLIAFAIAWIPRGNDPR